MKEQEIKGVKWNCLFYQPEDKMLVQIYHKRTEDVIVEEVIENQEEYDYALSVFLEINEKLKRETRKKIEEFFSK